MDAVRDVNSGVSRVEDFEHSLASIGSTYRTTAVLEAGRRSLDEKRTIRILYANAGLPGKNNSIFPTGFA